MANEIGLNLVADPFQEGTIQTGAGAQPVEALPGAQPLISPAREELQKALEQDITRATQAVGRTGQRLGVAAAPAEARFAERGIRIGNKLVAQNELKRALEQQQIAVKSFVTGAGFADQVSTGIAQQSLNDRLNTIRQGLLKQGLEFQRKLAEQKVSASEQRRAAKNFGAAAGAIAGGILGASFGGPGGAFLGAGAGAQIGGTVGGAA